MSRAKQLHTKSRFIGFRLSPDEQAKLIALSLLTSEPGNMSAAIRMLIAKAPDVKIDKESAIEALRQMDFHP